MQLNKELFALDRFTKEDLTLFIARYKDNPVLFAQEILGLDPDDNQRAIIQSVLDNKYTSVGSGRGIGKTYVIAMLALWALCTKPEMIVLVSSNTASQSKSTIWAPLIKILSASSIADWFDVTTELIHFKGDSSTAYIKRLIWSEHNVEAVAGYHSDNMLYLLDEASKYPSAVIDTIRGSCTQDWNKILLTSNPTLTSGYFYETYSNPRWNFLEIDSRSSRHTNKEEIDAVIAEYGEDGDYTRVQVLGKFPRQSANSMIPSDILNASFSATPPASTDMDLTVIGLDVGAGKDKSVWTVRQGNSLVDVVSLTTPDDQQILDKSKELCAKYKADRLIYDRSGIGMFLQPRMEQACGPMVDVIGIVFSQSSPDPSCANIRDWMYKRLADWFKGGGIIGNRPDIKKQLTATVYVMTDKGQIKLIPKKDIIKEIGHSPDEADSLALSCAFMGNLTAGIAINHSMNSHVVATSFANAISWRK